MKLSELAAQTFSTIGNGSPDLEITAASGLDLASQGDITFLANPKYTPQIAVTKASAIFLDEKTETGRDDLAVLRSADPYVAYTRALRLFNPEPELRPFRHPAAVIDDTASVGPK
ncbi:MAG: LpxD N-terminal domain-containing protein, partial [Acidobacteriota bacterium]